MLFVPKRIITGVITASTPTINQCSTNALYLSLEPLSLLFNFVKLWRPTMMRRPLFIIPSLIEWGLYCNHLIRPSVCPSVRSHFRNRYLSFYWKKWFDIWYMALAWWLVPCLPFPGLPHIYFLFTVRLRIFHVCRNENFRNSYLSFYWKKWFYIWYMALAWCLVPCLPFPGLQHIYFLFTVRLTNEWGGILSTR
jgi:hypothetical protein